MVVVCYRLQANWKHFKLQRKSKGKKKKETYDEPSTMLQTFGFGTAIDLTGVDIIHNYLVYTRTEKNCVMKTR